MDGSEKCSRQLGFQLQSLVVIEKRYNEHTYSRTKFLRLEKPPIEVWEKLLEPTYLWKINKA